MLEDSVSITNITSIDDGDTGFVLLSAAVVLTMTPGVGIFYAGFLQQFHVIHVLLQTFACLPIVALQWVVYGYSIVFSEGQTALGGHSWTFLRLPNVSIYSETIPPLAHAGFQLMFAIVSSALIIGALGNRIKFTHWAIFTLLWQTFSYDIIARALWSKNPDMTKGFLAQQGALDFAGGLVVHANAGFSALVASWILRDVERTKLPKPHSVPLIFIGFLMLWFGWTMFNAGSALKANYIASQAFVNTNIAAASGASVMLLDLINPYREFTASLSVGMTGAVVGMVAITPSAGYVQTWAALCIGIITSTIVYGIALLKLKLQNSKFKHILGNDVLDVFLCHGVGGSVGALLTGVFATTEVNKFGGNGLITGSGQLLKHQFTAVITVFGISGAVTLAILMPFVLFASKVKAFHPLENPNAYDGERYGGKAYDDTDVVVRDDEGTALRNTREE